MPLSSVTVATLVPLGGAPVSVSVKAGITGQTSQDCRDDEGSRGAKRSLLRSCLHGPSLLKYLGAKSSSLPGFPRTDLAQHTLQSHHAYLHPPASPGTTPAPDIPRGYLPLGLCSSHTLCLGRPPALISRKFHPSSMPFPEAISSQSPSTPGLPFPHRQGTVTACHE